MNVLYKKSVALLCILCIATSVQANWWEEAKNFFKMAAVAGTAIVLYARTQSPQEVVIEAEVPELRFVQEEMNKLKKALEDRPVSSLSAKDIEDLKGHIAYQEKMADRLVQFDEFEGLLKQFSQCQEVLKESANLYKEHAQQLEADKKGYTQEIHDFMQRFRDEMSESQSQHIKVVNEKISNVNFSEQQLQQLRSMVETDDCGTLPWCAELSKNVQKVKDDTQELAQVVELMQRIVGQGIQDEKKEIVSLSAQSLDMLGEMHRLRESIVALEESVLVLSRQKPLSSYYDDSEEEIENIALTMSTSVLPDQPEQQQ